MCAVGADVVPDSYLAYHTMCAQLFGTAKAAAILYPPLTVSSILQANSACAFVNPIARERRADIVMKCPSPCGQ
jgi:hypothetical protein